MINILDLRDIDTSVCDYFVICNEIQTHRLTRLLTPFKKLFKRIKDKPWHVEGSDNAEWVLMDYVNVVVHVFKNKYANITISRICGEMQKSLQ
jgi:ribosome-associated protein